MQVIFLISISYDTDVINISSIPAQAYNFNRSFYRRDYYEKTIKKTF